jgi:hypothetical protein
VVSLVNHPKTHAELQRRSPTPRLVSREDHITATMNVSGAFNQLDTALSSLLGQWNAYSTGIVTTLVAIVTYSLWTRVDPDIHPMLLARQAQGSPVRTEGESPIYRGNSAPHGMPLNSGLGVKPPGAPRWSQGRDGDLRDVWRRVVSGTPEGEASAKGKGKIFTVLGTEKVTDHNLGKSLIWTVETQTASLISL